MHARAAVAVVAEDAAHAGPHVGHLLGRHEDAEADRELGVGRQAAADPEVVARAELRVHDADERDVVDLVVGAVHRAAGDGGLELAREVREGRVPDVAVPHLLQHLGGVEHLGAVDAGERAADDDARAVAARLGGVQAHGVEPLPDRRDVLDADPVQLHVLAVRDVGHVAAVLGADLADHPQLLVGELAAVDADAQHEERRLELLGLEHGGLAAGDALGALGVEAVPAEAPAQVTAVDAVEAGPGVGVEDPLLDGQRVAVLLGLLVGVQGLSVAERPLALSARGGHGGLLGSWCGGGRGRGSAPGTHRAAGALQVDVQSRRQQRTHGVKGGTGAAGAPLCDPGKVIDTWLVARLHVDLQRVSSAVCSRVA